MWLTASRRLFLSGYNELPKSLMGFQGVLYMARKMEYELSRSEIDLANLRGSQLQKEVEKSLQGGSISLESELGPRHQRHPFRWTMGEKWFYGGSLFLTGGTLSISILLPFLLYRPWILGAIYCALWVGVFNAMTIGSSPKNRVFMVVSWVILGTVAGIFSIIAGTSDAAAEFHSYSMGFKYLWSCYEY